MKRKVKTQKGYKRYIILGFFTMYLISMILSTYLMKEHFITAYQQETRDIIDNSVKQIERVVPNENPVSHSNLINYMEKEISSSLKSSSEYSMISMGIYDEDGNLLTSSNSSFHPILSLNDLPSGKPYSFEEIFTKEEQDQLKKCYIEEWEKLQTMQADQELTLYQCSTCYDEDVTLMMFEIRQTIEEQFTDEQLFIWKNPEYKSGKLYGSIYTEGDIFDYISLPYLQYGEDAFNRWKQDKYLHTFHFDEDSVVWRNVHVPLETGKYTFKYLNQIWIENYNGTEDTYILQMNQRIYPWHAAASYLKHIYIFSAVIMGMCAIIVLYFTDKTYRKQMELEQTRRDFTNAAAHELKTPLAIVRNLFENMERETSEEKNEYYRKEGIRQTEVMDNLIKEMIFISKLDSDKVKLRQETVSSLSIMEEQISILEPMLDEKNLHVQFFKEEDFTITGDRTYLEKAFFNLLENAVTYNRMDGRISIHITKDFCTIENTSNPIPEDDLPHVYDMFFTSNKSRKSDVNHKGLGLYLTKRILDLHKLNIGIENTEIGVKVILTKS